MSPQSDNVEKSKAKVAQAKKFTFEVKALAVKGVVDTFLKLVT